MIHHLSPIGLPSGIDPIEWRSAISQCIEGHLEAVEALVAALDSMTRDPDFELSGDLEPWLGWAGNGPASYDRGDDREEINEDGGNVTDEPHDEADEGNADYCLADEMGQGWAMTYAEKKAVVSQVEGLLAKLPRRHGGRDPDELTIIGHGVARVGAW